MEIQVTVHINASPQEVWGVLKDVSRWQEWYGVPMTEADWRSGGHLRYAPHDGIRGGAIPLANYIEGQTVTLAGYWADDVYSLRPEGNGCALEKRVVPKNGANFTADGYPRERQKQQGYLNAFRDLVERTYPRAAPLSAGMTADAGEMASEKHARKKPVALLVALGAVIVLAVLAVVLSPMLREQARIRQYNEGAAYLEQGAYDQALEVFGDLGDYEDAPELAAYAEKGVAYTAAKRSMDRDEFAEAKAAFEALNGFKDSAALAEECGQALAYAEGKRLFEAGDYAAALEALERSGGYSGSAALIAECRAVLDRQEIRDAMARGDYARALELLDTPAGEGMEDRDALIAECGQGLAYQEAEAAYNDGLYYTAYGLFTGLGAYRDSAQRAQACIRPRPATGETYHNSAYANTSCSLQIKPPTGDGSYTYFKIYAVSGADEILVSSVFINAGGNATVRLPAGTYVFKQAYGTGDWYGEQEMLGPKGTYQRLKSSSSSDQFTLERNGSYVLTLRAASDGNVGTRNESRDDF